MPPTLVSYNETQNTLATGATGVTSPSIAAQVGDLAVIWGGSEDATNGGNVLTLSALGGITGTVTPIQSDTTASYAMCAIGSAPVTSSGNLQGKAVGSGTTAQLWTCGVWLFRGHGGIGVSNKARGATGTVPSVALAGCSAGSAIAAVVTDWSAKSGARTYTQVNGANPTERGHFGDDAHWHYDAFDYADVGAAGSKTIGESAPITQTPIILGVEVLASAASVWKQLSSSMKRKRVPS